MGGSQGAPRSARHEADGAAPLGWGLWEAGATACCLNGYFCSAPPSGLRREWRRGLGDYVILHLMAYYGLRPSEVVALTLDSIDWTGRTLRVVQRKTRSVLVLPLADRTVRLLRRYLDERPSIHRPELFLRTRSPAGSLTHYSVGDLFHKRAQQSGLPLQGASPYSLRHAFAMRLLRRGVGVKAIGDLLGHHSLESTCAYLRTVALPVPTLTDS